MPKLTLEQRHSLPLDEVKKRIDGLVAQLGAKYGITSRWLNDREADIKATGATGKIKFDEATVKLLVDLSFALTPIKGKVEDRLMRELKTALT